MQDATQAVRCLTILAQLTGVDLLIPLWPVTLRIGRLVSGFRRGTLSPETMFPFESALQDFLRQAGRLIVQWTVNHLEPDDDLHQEMPRLFLWDGEYHRRRKKSSLRNLNGLFGPIALRRFYYQPTGDTANRQKRVPLSGLSGSVNSDGILSRSLLSVGRDGVMIPIVNSQTYKEAAAATVSVLDRWGRRLGTVSLGQMPEAHQTSLGDDLTRLLRDVLSRGDGSLPRLVYVTDCGHHPTVYFEEVLSRMINPQRPAESLPGEWIVDDGHACEDITKLAESIFGPGRETFAWAAKQRRLLKEKPGGVFRVLRSAGALLTIRGLVGNEDLYWKGYLYLRERASKMDYVIYRRLRMPIGSGITEAACKTVFTQRFKQSGMKWTIEGGRPILALRVIALSGVWDQVRQATLKSSPMPQPVTPKPSTNENNNKPLKTAA